MDVGNLNIKITADTRGVDAGITKTKRALGSVANEAQGFGAKLQSGFDAIGIGGVLAVGAVTAAVGKFASDSVKAAVSFDSSMANINSILQLSGSEIDALGGKILAFGATTRAGPQAVAEAFTEIVGGVADASTHMAILEASVAAAEAGNANLTATTGALVSVMNSYGFEASKAAFVSDVMTKTVGDGVGSMDEFAAAMGLTAGLAASVGVEFDALGGSMAWLTTKGFSAAQAGTRLTAVMTAFLKPNDKMKKALIKMGVESGEAGLELYGLAGMTGRLEQAMGGSTTAMSEALGTTEALTAAVALNGPGFEEFIGNFEDTAVGATEAARAIQNASTAASFERFNAQVERAQVLLGGLAAPVLEGAANIVVTGLQAGADIFTQAGEIGQKIGARISEAIHIDLTPPTNVPVPNDMAGAIRTSIETWMLDNLIVVGTPLQVAYDKILVAGDIADKINTALNMDLAGTGIKPLDIVTTVATTLVPPSVQELAGQASAFITQLNETGLTPGQHMMINAIVGFQSITTDVPAMISQIGDTLTSFIDTAVQIVTPIAILPGGVEIMSTGTPWLDSVLQTAAGAVGRANTVAMAAEAGIINIQSDLVILPGGVSYRRTGTWMDGVFGAVFEGISQASIMADTRVAFSAGGDVTMIPTVINREGLAADVTGQTSTILDEAAIAVVTPGTVAVDATLGNGLQVAQAVIGDMQSQNYDTSVNATLTVRQTVKTITDFVDQLTLEPGMNHPGVGGGLDRDNNIYTPMRTGGKVPYDNFAALLHKGEIVVPANYADGVGRGGVTIIVNASNLMGSRQEVIEWVREGMAESGY